jgi:hypothetical protein
MTLFFRFSLPRNAVEFFVEVPLDTGLNARLAAILPPEACAEARDRKGTRRFWSCNARELRQLEEVNHEERLGLKFAYKGLDGQIRALPKRPNGRLRKHW